VPAPKRPPKTNRRHTPAPSRELAAAIGSRIRALRVAKGLSATALGAPYYTRAHVSAIELGKIHGSIAALHHFASKLGVQLRELIPPEV
jgi:transcriptional regulator with XRE-family HTH domain